MNTTLPATPGVYSQISLDSLRLDPLNPRIPESMRGENTPDLAVLLEIGFEAFSVAQSIAELGFFHAEPLIVVPAENTPNEWVVVEGNRRLTALLGLADSEIRKNFSEPSKWDALAAKRPINMKMLIPVVVHHSRETTHAEIARVHVVGKLAWRPFPQARYIAARVEEGRSLQEVADLIGIPKATASALYRDQAILMQAQALGLETAQAESAFSVLSVAMGNTNIREHIAAPLGSRVELGVDPIPSTKIEELREVLTWVFGTEDQEPVISDSRQMGQLGNVVSSPVGLSTLRQGKTLEEAKQKVSAAGLDPVDSLKRRLNTAKAALVSASSDIGEHFDEPEILTLINDIDSAVESLRAAADDLSM